MAFGRNQSAPMVRTLRWCGSSMWISVRKPMPASSWAGHAVVGRGGRQQRARLGQEQVVGPLDGHDVGVLGDRPERPVRRVVDPRNGFVGPQMGERGVQPGVVGVRRRIGQYFRGVVHSGHGDRRTAHRAPCSRQLTGVKGSVCDRRHSPDRQVRARHPRCQGRPSPPGAATLGQRADRRSSRVRSVLAALVMVGRLRTRCAAGARAARRPGAGADGGGHAARRGHRRSSAVRRNSLRRPAGRPAAVRPTRNRRRPGRACATRRRSVRDACRSLDGDPELGSQTDEDCLTLNVWTPRSPPAAATGHGVDSRRGVRQRQRQDLRRPMAGDPRRHHRRHHQLPARHAGLPGPSGARAAPATSATTAWPTSRRRCAGSGTTSRRSAATRSGSRSPGSPPAACRCATTSSLRAPAACSRAAIIQSAPCQAQAAVCRWRRTDPSTTRPAAAAGTRRTRRAACGRCLPTSCASRPGSTTSATTNSPAR